MLQCNDNQLNSLDLSNNKELIYLICTGNNLSSLDVLNCPKIEDIFCGLNPITTLDLSNNKELRFLELYGLKSKSLPKIRFIKCSSLNLLLHFLKNRFRYNLTFIFNKTTKLTFFFQFTKYNNYSP